MRRIRGTRTLCVFVKKAVENGTDYDTILRAQHTIIRIFKNLEIGTSSGNVPSVIKTMFIILERLCLVVVVGIECDRSACCGWGFR
jgi:hypothetical protein